MGTQDAGIVRTGTSREDEEEQYVILEFDGISADELRGELSLQDLDGDAPTATLGQRIMQGTYDEDVGSTLVFDRAVLKRVASAEAGERRDEPDEVAATGGARCSPHQPRTGG